MSFTLSRIICNEFKMIVKCSSLLIGFVFAHEFAHFNTANIFSLLNFLRFSSFTSHKFICVNISWCDLKQPISGVDDMKLFFPRQ